ncbi:MAG: NAD(P)/FAD-dependent oxidoreductase [Actinobacteria bacterium]|nr:NAD(P)/FAD-dependent oxidoreductase [Actinomycetota bacterium]
MSTEHDVIVIGMGVGGEEVATRTAGPGLDVLAVEKKLVGGECPYWGCIPSKVMVRAGNTLAEAARATGLAGEAKISADWAPVAARVRKFTADWNDQAAVERHEKQGATVVHGEARIVGPGRIEVDGEQHSARRGIVVATGGEPAVPPIDGLEDVDYWTNREAIEAERPPASLIVLGAGPIGLELAQVYSRFGTKVSVVEIAGHPLPPEEPENGEALGAVLRDEGLELHMDSSAESVSSSGRGIEVHLKGGTTLEAERLLVATGRRHNLKALGLDALGLDPDAKSIGVDDRLRAADGLWAVGDVTGKGEFTHVAVYQGRVAAADILGRDHAPADYLAVPRVTYTDPEVASVGLSEKVAREQGLSIKTGVAETKASARGYIHGPGAEHGVAKLIADADEGILLGASVMGPAAGEVLGLLVLAVKARIPIATLRDLIYPYPTFVRGLEDALTALG